MASLISGPLSVTDLLNHKALQPLDAAAQTILVRTQSLDVTDYTEADVREEIISPLLKVLGYDKQSYFSVEREKSIQLPGRKNFLDYSLTLWSQNFWLIETKKPGNSPRKFGAAEIRQIVGYAVHPEINAALAVLCDGHTIAIFDREENLVEPILTVKLANLQQEIDKLRAILSPWQVWFFEKRRIVRHLDKVFDKEFNMRRVEEFKSLVTRRLDSKRGTVIENMRAVFANSDDTEQALQKLRAKGPVDLIEGAFFFDLPVGQTMAIAETLASHCRKRAFHILYRVFPDYARDMNDQYCMHAFNLHIHLHNGNVKVDWLPSWLGSQNDLVSAIKAVATKCPTYFTADPVRRNILLCAAALRRLIKVSIVVENDLWRVGEIMHARRRYEDPEDEWTQILSSPESQNLDLLDRFATVSIRRLVTDCSNDHGQPQPSLIESQLREIWKGELAILGTLTSYHDLCRERNVGEVFPTEMIDVTYDWLGHSVLCIADHHPVWKRHILEQHYQEVETLAQIGSWQARKWLGNEEDKSYSTPTDQAMADRFFLGDLEAYRGLKTRYGYD